MKKSNECKYRGCSNRAAKDKACLSCWYAAQSRALKRRDFSEYQRLRAEADAAFQAIREEFDLPAPDPEDLQ
jgi:hypothetical protein